MVVPFILLASIGITLVILSGAYGEYLFFLFGVSSIIISILLLGIDTSTTEEKLIKTVSVNKEDPTNVLCDFKDTIFRTKDPLIRLSDSVDLFEEYTKSKSGEVLSRRYIIRANPQ